MKAVHHFFSFAPTVDNKEKKSRASEAAAAAAGAR